MKIMLDSSFFFPFIGVAVKGVNSGVLVSLFQSQDYEIHRSEISTFELSAKGTKYVNEGKLDINDLIHGMNTLIYNSNVQVLPYYYSDIQSLSTEFRKSHSDFIDCLILATAINYAELLITMDEIIKEKSLTIWKNIIHQNNNKFNVQLWKEFNMSMNE